MQEEEILGKAYDSRLMRRLLVYLLPYRRMVLFALLLIIVESLIEVSFPWLTLVAVDNYILAGDMSGRFRGLVPALVSGYMAGLSAGQRLDSSER